MACLENMMQRQTAQLFQYLSELQHTMQQVKSTVEHNYNQSVQDLEDQVEKLRQQREELVETLAIEKMSSDAKIAELTKALEEAKKELKSQEDIVRELRTELAITAESMITRSRVIGLTWGEGTSWDNPTAGDYQPGRNSQDMEPEPIIPCTDTEEDKDEDKDKEPREPREAGTGWGTINVHTDCHRYQRM